MSTLYLPGLETPTPVQSPDSNEWYTPRHIIEAARRVMGGIDLDPASCAAANEVVQATTYYTKEQDGLAQPWGGKVWLNPPYGRGIVERFAARVYAADRAYSVDALCLLTNNSTDTVWWQGLAQVAQAVCFLRGRLAFWGPNETGNGAAQGQSVMLFNPHRDAEVLARFCDEFSQLGWVGAA